MAKELTMQDFTFKTKPLNHQFEALKKSATKQNFAYLMEMGCVDGETEFLSNRGWVKFKDFELDKWEAPLLVGQVTDPEYPDDGAHAHFTFVQPISYIKKEVDEMIHFTGYTEGCSTPCLDIMVTPDHNMRAELINSTTLIKRREDDVSAQQLAEWVEARPAKIGRYDGRRGHILQRCWTHDGVLGYAPEDTVLNKLTNWELRLMVAIMADGNFPRKHENKCVMEFSKEHKITRFEMLCRRAGVMTVRESIRGGASTRFNLIAPLRKKIYDEEFWLLPPDKLAIIFDEIFRWDGSIENTRKRFYTIHKSSADFVQFLCSIHGYRSSIITTTSNGAPYYTVSMNPKAHMSSIKFNPFTTVPECQRIKGKQMSYCFRVPSGQLLLRRNNKVFVTGNSGKSKVIIDNMAFLKQRGSIDAAVVIAPKGVYRNWSTQEIPKHMPDEVNAKILLWKSDATKKAKMELIETIKAYDKEKDADTFPILVFNIESVLSDTGYLTLMTFLKKHAKRVMGVIDESTCIKNHRAKRTRKALEVSKYCKVRRIATGSPITNSPLDLYSQFAFLDKEIIGCGSYYAFRNVFADMERITNRQGQSFDKILRYKNLPLLSKRIEDFSFRVTKKECLDLPDKIYITRDVALTPEQTRMYKEMKNLSFAVREPDEIMSVQVALTKMLRLHQILCGSFTTDDGEIHPIPNNRLNALEEVLDETSGKVIIWANYLQNIQDITDMLAKKYGPESFVTYTGSVTSDSRVEAIQLFQNMNSPVRFFVGNVQTAGRGITLTAANTVVYYSNNYSLEMRQQSEDRAHRVGQTNQVTYVDLVVPGTLDEKIIQALLAKRNIANEILNDDLDEWINI